MSTDTEKVESLVLELVKPGGFPRKFLQEEIRRETDLPKWQIGEIINRMIREGLVGTKEVKGESSWVVKGMNKRAARAAQFRQRKVN